MFTPTDKTPDVAMQQQRLETRYRAAMARLGVDRSDAAAWVALGEVTLEGERPAGLFALADKARAHGGDSLALRCLEARACLLLGRRAEARERAQALARSRPEDPTEADTIGVLLVHVDLVEAALPFFETATAAAPGNPAFAYNLATTQQFCGRIEAARATFARLVEQHPQLAKGWLGWVQVGGGAPRDLPMLEAKLDASEDPIDRLYYGHAGARLCERAGEDGAAMRWLERAKAAHRARLDHDPDWVDALFAAASANIDAAARAAAAAAPAATAGPLFILGMPRSGTTLIERVLGGHEAVASAGELSDFALAVRRHAAASGPLVLSPEALAARVDLDAVGDAYRRQTAPLAPGARHLIDKMPFNFFFVPQILRALPEARVLVVRRGDEDLAIANYRQLFATRFGYYDYHYDLDWTVRFVARAQRLMDRFEAALGGPRLRAVRYEAMTADLAGEAGAIVDWLGLDWSDGLLRFHERKAAVTTASSVQVREPVHRRSVERWRRYGATSAALAAAFERERAAARRLMT
ncbi:tetratricopeptide repeat-containing sulfotransferase family protein [Sphingomicrobium astaxanthinifaciens]|uniref:tetratricopeptide repeat-containing sulfotransferase family protein n=1 Tax=Sphingomicrobium astaxanthinifaciens TaxID=1227949 RepID=UPI001FCBC1CE|nr:sulfotransferase [Sphingomicrobium astaxanthinifaciens]MCJ7422288.1 sulfotransferase [Sphingomicrobium astaxanthinifaciens]